MIIPDTNNVMQVGSESQETWDTGPALPFQNAGGLPQPCPSTQGLLSLNYKVKEGLDVFTSLVPCCLTCQDFISGRLT